MKTMKPTLTTINLQALEAGLTEGHRLAAAAHAAPETIGQIIERLHLLAEDHAPDGWPAVRMRDITALIAHIDWHHSEGNLEMVGQWYMVNKDGAATLCVDRADAEKEAANANLTWPKRLGPHRAVQLVEAGDIAALKGQRAVLCSLLRECLPVIDALMQAPGDDDSDARLNGLAGRIIGALKAIAEDQGKGGES